jgi:hypothetical protein
VGCAGEFGKIEIRNNAEKGEGREKREKGGSVLGRLAHTKQKGLKSIGRTGSHV